MLKFLLGPCRSFEKWLALLALCAAGCGGPANTQAPPADKSAQAAGLPKETDSPKETGSGTQPPSGTSPVQSPTGPAATASSKRIDPGQAKWIETSSLPVEYWEAQYLNGARIGTTHYKVSPSKTQGANLLNVSSTTTMELLRAGQKIRQTISVESLETPVGELQHYAEKTEVAGNAVDVAGPVAGGQLRLNMTAADKQTPVPVNWNASTWGPLGVHQILRMHPMKTGERVSASVFVPQMHKIAQVELIGGEMESTALPGGVTKQLLPVEVVMMVDRDAVVSHLWVNEQGEVLKSIVLVGLNISSYRVTKEEAEKFEAESKVDLVIETSIKLPQPIPNASKTNRIVYAIEAAAADPYGMLSRETNQTSKSITARMAELTVERIDPSAAKSSQAQQTPPTAEHLQPSPLIQSSDEIISKLAKELVGDGSDPAQQAMQLTRGIHARIAKKNFSRGFDSALEVAKSLEGDCTEHAVLLAAVLRNQSIPSRVASGVVYTEASGTPSFVYHMWTEAWVGDHWLPLDATLGDVAGPDHIKFIESALSDSNPYSALLPVLNSIGQLKISVIRTE